jgi:pyruvate-formate lyase
MNQETWMYEATDRIVRLREQTLRCPMMSELAGQGWGPRKGLLLAEGWIASAGQPTTRLRRTASLVYRMAHEGVVINDHELIVGCADLSELTEDEQRRLDELANTVRRCVPQSRGPYDHMALDYEKLIRVGLDGLIAEVEQHRKALCPQLPENVSKDEFYHGCLLELNALKGLAGRYVAQARSMAEGAPPERARELLEIADILAKVPAEPAETFREALQSIHFYTFLLEGDYQLGRPDQFLVDLYRADVASGRLTPAGALELIDCFCLLYSACHPRGSAVGFMVGGRDCDANPVHNELTYLFLHSIAHTRLAYPGIGLCVHDETPDELLDLAVDMLSNGYSHPAIFNDRAISRGLVELGVPERDAHHYVHSSCVEITLCGQSGCWVFNPTINTVKLFLEVMEGNLDCGGLEDLMCAYERALRDNVLSEVHTRKLWQLERSRNGGGGLLSSCLVNSCLRSGKAVDEGGANYNPIMPTFLGTANLVDSIVATKILVFDEKELTMAELHRIVMDDFEGHETLRQRIVNDLPHFGNDEQETDGLMREVSEMLVRVCEGIVTLYGSKAVPGVFSYKVHVAEGEKTPASPDGRKAFTSLAAASSPVQGRDVSGPTASILSSTCWDQLPFMGGVATNFTFQPGGAATRKGMEAVIRTMIDKGGLQLQVNCVSREALLDARENPDNHRDLLVRIAGYSDYFTSLPPAMQDEIVNRTGHE